MCAVSSQALVVAMRKLDGLIYATYLDWFANPAKKPASVMRLGAPNKNRGALFFFCGGKNA